MAMLRDVAPRAKAGTTAKARRLRKEMSLPEVLLWQGLRARPGGLKFRRQHPSGPYILDFYCNDARLTIEVDGEAHSRANRPQRDIARDDWFDLADIVTLRIPAAEILRDLDAILAGILAEAFARLPLHHPALPGGPPPRDELGEDF